MGRVWEGVRRKDLLEEVRHPQREVWEAQPCPKDRTRASLTTEHAWQAPDGRAEAVRAGCSPEARLGRAGAAAGWPLRAEAGRAGRKQAPGVLYGLLPAEGGRLHVTVRDRVQALLCSQEENTRRSM